MPGYDQTLLYDLVCSFSDKKYNTNDKERWIDVSIRNRQAFCTIENLQPDSTYSIRIRSVNELGQSKPSHSVRAKTMSKLISVFFPPSMRTFLQRYIAPTFSFPYIARPVKLEVVFPLSYFLCFRHYSKLLFLCN